MFRLNDIVIVLLIFFFFLCASCRSSGCIAFGVVAFSNGVVLHELARM